VDEYGTHHANFNSNKGEHPVRGVNRISVEAPLVEVVEAPLVEVVEESAA
jgi:hypothetical protein